MLKKSIFLFLAICLIVAAGCASVKHTRSGFLKNYDDFTESQRYPGMLVDNKNLAKMNDYNKYLIDPVVINFENKAKRDKVPQDVQQDIANFFHNEIVNDLQDKYQIVDTPGAGVLRIRLAITDMEASTPYLNVALATKITQAGAGGASMEGEAVDSVTGERIAAVIDSSKGSEWDIAGGLAEWGYAKDVCSDWAKRFRERLDVGYQDIAPVVNSANSSTTTADNTAAVAVATTDNAVATTDNATVTTDNSVAVSDNSVN